MNVLAIDTSSPLGSVALTVDRELVAEISLRGTARHGETVLPHVEQALRGANLEPSALDLLAVGLGPGSFTGTRIGVATAKGLHLATGAPLVGVDSLRVVAYGCGEGPCAAVLDAQRGEVFVAAFDRAAGVVTELLAPFVAPPSLAFARLARLALVRRLRVAGDGARRYADVLASAFESSDPGRLGLLSPVFDRPRAALLADLAADRFREEGASDALTLEPFYVRPSDAERVASAADGQASR